MLQQDIIRKIEEIRRDNISGASTLTQKSLEVFRAYLTTTEVKDHREFSSRINEIREKLIHAQPTMSSIKNLTDLVVAESSKLQRHANLLRRKVVLLRFLDRLEKRITSSKQIIAQHMARLIKGKVTVITCSYSSTVVEVINHLHSKKRIVEVIIPESRPIYEGHRAAEQLAARGVKVTLIVDAAMGFFAQRCDVAIVGADTVFSDGAVVNKAGTYLLALACYDLKAPFYVVCESLKLSKDPFDLSRIAIEEKPGEEMIEAKVLPGVNVKNVYFDITPPQYVTRIVTEEGVFHPKPSTHGWTLKEN